MSEQQKWTEGEVDGLVFRLLHAAYRRDNKTCRFLIQQLREELLRELT
jgi:hypothetical protein